MNRWSNAGRVVVLVLAVATFGGIGPATLARQEAPPVIEVGAGPIGEPSLRLVGRALYEPERITLVGYLVAAKNLGAEAMFTQAPPDAATARFTFAAEIAIADQSTRADVRLVAGDGELRIYRDDGGADWSDPASFTTGEEVAAFAIGLRETLQRQDPTIGVVVGDGQLTQESAGEFALDDVELRFGSVGIASRLRYTGALFADERAASSTAASFLGAITVTARDARPVPLGASAAATP